jgi:REP element-mobilizing transposase RayT
VARSARLELAGGIHHVWQRGNNRQPIFVEPADRRFFLALLREIGGKYQWHCLGYCLMENHFHLVLETPRCTLGSGMRDLGSRYAQWFHNRHATGGGHLFQARFGSKLVLRDDQFAQLLRYVARNPVRAGLCERPEDWTWSSHRALMSGDPHPLIAVDRVYGWLAGIVSTGNPYRRLFDPEGPMRAIDPDLNPWNLRRALSELFAKADASVALRAARDEGYRLAEIAAYLGVSEATVSRRLARVT